MRIDIQQNDQVPGLSLSRGTAVHPRCRGASSSIIDTDKGGASELEVQASPHYLLSISVRHHQLESIGYVSGDMYRSGVKQKGINDDDDRKSYHHRPVRINFARFINPSITYVTLRLEQHNEQ